MRLSCTPFARTASQSSRLAARFRTAGAVSIPEYTAAGATGTPRSPSKETLQRGRGRGENGHCRLGNVARNQAVNDRDKTFRLLGFFEAANVVVKAVRARVEHVRGAGGRACHGVKKACSLRRTSKSRSKRNIYAMRGGQISFPFFHLHFLNRGCERARKQHVFGPQIWLRRQGSSPALSGNGNRRQQQRR